MFRTYRHAELPGNALFGDEIQRWSYIEHCLHRPWFYVTVAEQCEGITLRNMLMLPDEQTLESLVEQQNGKLHIESIQLVSPAYINQSNKWLMETLIDLKLISSTKPRHYTYLYHVEGGKMYTDNNDTKNKICKNLTEKTIYSIKQN